MKKKKIPWKKMYFLFKELRKDPKKVYIKIDEMNLLLLDEKGKREYKKLKKRFIRFKEEIGKRAQTPLLDKKILNIIKNKKNRKLIEEEIILGRNLDLAEEKQIFSIFVIKKIHKKLKRGRKLTYNEIYTLVNLYRSFSEVSKNLLMDALFKIVEIKKEKYSNNKKKLKEYLKLESKLKKNKIDLGDVSYLLGSFDKELRPKKLNLKKTFENYFGYMGKRKGFYLRNQSAHEKYFFNEINPFKYLEGIKKINLLNSAFISVFYLNPLKDLPTREITQDIEKKYSHLLPKGYSLLLKVINKR